MPENSYRMISLLDGDRNLECEALDLNPVSVFKLAVQLREQLEASHADAPSHDAKWNAIAADILLIGVKLGRGAL